jgi:hypothetical protein
MNLIPSQLYQQQQYTMNQVNNNNNNNSSTSPLSTNSYLSSSSSTSSYSPQTASSTTTTTTASSAQQHIQQQQQQIANSTGPALYMTTTGPNGSPLILSIPTQNNIVNFDPGMYHQMNTTKPEAKKVKIQKSQPSKVVHIRNIPPQISEVEVIQFGLIFGNIANVLNLRSKCQVCVFF